MKNPVLATVLLLCSPAALAHHPLEGMPVETFTQGLMSGVGHPFLGYDHLFFVVLVGIGSVFTGHRLLAPLAYITAMLIGCLVASSWQVLPVSELMAALSLLVLGGIMLSGYHLRFVPAIAIFALFGLFHGSAFGSFLAAQETAAGFPVLIGYLLGLGVTQYGITLGAGWICHEVWKASEPVAIQPRLVGALVAGAGLLLTLESIGAR